MKLGPKQRPRRSEAMKAVGADRGLKDFASLRDRHVIGPARHYGKLEAELAKAQRARKKARAPALHAKKFMERPVAQASTALVE